MSSVLSSSVWLDVYLMRPARSGSLCMRAVFPMVVACHVEWSTVFVRVHIFISSYTLTLTAHAIKLES